MIGTDLFLKAIVKTINDVSFLFGFVFMRLIPTFQSQSLDTSDPSDAINIDVCRGEAARIEEKKGIIEWALVYGVRPSRRLNHSFVFRFKVIGNSLEPFQSRETTVSLLQLQSLFSVQLPKMPKEYITRLVFDDRHRSMVLLKKGKLPSHFSYSSCSQSYWFIFFKERELLAAFASVRSPLRALSRLSSVRLQRMNRLVNRQGSCSILYQWGICSVYMKGEIVDHYLPFK